MTQTISVNPIDVPSSTFHYRNLALAACAWLPLLAIGCGTLNPFRPRTSPIDHIPDAPPLDPSHGWAFLGWLGFVCIAGGIGILVASTFVPILPRKAAFTAIVCGVGCVLARGFLDRFGEAIMWGALGLFVVGVGCMIWPLLVAGYRGTLLAKSRELFAAGHVDAAAAFKITATPGASKSRDIRKAILSTMKGNS